MRAHPRRGPMEHRTQLEIDGLQRAEGMLNAAETFVGAHCCGGIGVFGGQIGANHIDAVERGLGGDAEGVLGEAEGIVGDADLEMLGHVAPSQHRADRLADRRGAVQRTARPLTRAAMRASSFSVAANSSARLRARSSASSGFLHTTRRSPG